MIQSLNFYDIYGYLIPGLILSILLWLPHGLATSKWPTADWTSALGAVVIGYVVGHLVQALGRNALPSRTMDGRFPSEALLDKDNQGLSPEFKMRLRERILALSGIDVQTDKTKSEVDEDKEISKRRKDGFVFCRDALLTSKTISYGEQMQGMYTLTGGLTVAFALGATYHLGWGLSGTQSGTLERFAWAGVGLGLVGAIGVAALGLEKARETRAKLMVGFIMFALLASGYLLGLKKVSDVDHWWLGAITLAGIFVSLTCYGAYKYFTRVYAETIYRAFSLYEKAGIEAVEKGGQSHPDPIRVYRIKLHRKH